MNKRNGTIDFLKFIFALIIILFHGSKSFIKDASQSFFLSGRLGVEFFFIVSGFFMASNIDRQENESDSKITGGGGRCFIHKKKNLSASS